LNEVVAAKKEKKAIGSLRAKKLEPAASKKSKVVLLQVGGRRLCEKPEI